MENVNNVDRPPLILAVDDLIENTMILHDFLTPRGYCVETASSGQEALDFVSASPPDLVLLDLVMPGMDGFAVMERLKGNPETERIPVIIITGLAEREANIKALEVGADDFIAKPFDAILLEARIRSSLRAKRLQDRIIQYQLELEEHNRTLEQRVAERTAQVARTQEVAVFSLATLAESRDTETGAHQNRMRSYAQLIAEELYRNSKYSNEMDDGFMDSMFLSSPLHDIGKVGIPDRILLKPGKLTEQEFEIMKTHTTIGGQTLERAEQEAGQDSFLVMARDIAYHHHERWDGSGYPFGLKEEAIPLSARIVAVSDVYDALTTRRPYKEPFTHEKSKAIIQEGCGSHFDPIVAEAFFAVEDGVLEIRDRFGDVEEVAPIQKLAEALEQGA